MNRDKNLPLTEVSDGQVRLAAGTLYGAIENLLKLKYIQPVFTEDKRRKVYQITAKGKEILQMDMQRMEHMVNVTKQSLLEMRGEIHEEI